MSMRVWKQLALEAAVPHPSDAIIRLALASMAADAQSSLTADQRRWVIALAQRTTRLTSKERMRLKTPLLQWAQTRMSKSYAVIAAQFHEEVD